MKFSPYALEMRVSLGGVACSPWREPSAVFSLVSAYFAVECMAKSRNVMHYENLSLQLERVDW
jgi:hypothetical protein